MASSRLLLPAPFRPVIRFRRGCGSTSTLVRQRKSWTRNRVRCMDGTMGTFHVERSTLVARLSEPQRHHHVAAALARGFPYQGRGIGVAELQHDLFIAEGG